MSVDVVRLRRRSDYLRVAATRLKAVTPGVIVQAAPREDDAIGVGYTASRRVGNAVLRNRARRRLKALAPPVLARSGRRATDYVLIARRETVDRPFANLVGDLEKALTRLGNAVPRS